MSGMLMWDGVLWWWELVEPGLEFLHLVDFLVEGLFSYN